LGTKQGQISNVPFNLKADFVLGIAGLPPALTSFFFDNTTQRILISLTWVLSGQLHTIRTTSAADDKLCCNGSSP
jgi:hypothetical protein